MSTPIKIKYPLFLRNINKGSVNEKEIKTIIDRQKGYPKVVIEGGTSMIFVNANSNIFYDIKNTSDDIIIIQQNIFEANNINGEMFILEFDDIEGLEVIFPDYPEEAFTEIKMQLMIMFSMIIVSKQNDKYKLYSYISEQPITEIAEVDNLDITDLEVLMEDIVITFKNIKFIEPNYNIMGYPVYVEEVESDNPEYKHKYKIVNNFIVMMMGLDIYYSNIPIEELNYIDIEGMTISLIKDNFKSLYDKNVGEFVFNFNTPANIEIICNWNNEEEPDFSKEGVMTVSIVNNIGTYTFIPS